MGAMGLSFRAISGNGICEEFLSVHPENCVEAELAIVMSWASFSIGESMYLSQSVSWISYQFIQLSSGSWFLGWTDILETWKG
jgi:hypothetical protein